MHTEIIGRQVAAESLTKFRVTYVDDSGSRAVAVAELGRWLVPFDPFPACIDQMKTEAAQRYLDENPVAKTWEICTVFGVAGFGDSQMALLEFIPELKIVRIGSDEISDEGFCHLSALTSLEVLHVHSRRLTPKCLQILPSLTCLRSLEVRSELIPTTALQSCLTSR